MSDEVTHPRSQGCNTVAEENNPRYSQGRNKEKGNTKPYCSQCRSTAA